MPVRALLQVESITEMHWYRDGKSVKLSAQYDTSIPEEARFCEATPSGTMELYITNPAALAEFALGKRFYVDFTEKPE